MQPPPPPQMVSNFYSLPLVLDDKIKGIHLLTASSINRIATFI